MIVVRFLGGMCNQMFQRAYGLALKNRGYEVAFDKSALVEGTHREYSLEEYFDLQFREPLGRTIYEKSLCFDAEMLQPPDNNTLVGYWQSEEYFKNEADFLRGRFNRHWMNKPLQPHSNAKVVSDEIYKSNSVFIHVRRQDYLTLQHYHGMPSLDYYGRAVEEIRSKVHDPSFFVFSDDPTWCKANFPSDFRVVEGTDKHEDLRLMACCKHAILANSSFSWWAAWIGDNQDCRMVVAPKRWFTADVENEIAPERWVRL